jgi:tRNA pseudouridine13 synthase
MSDRLEDSTRPAKRARLDDNTTPSILAETAAQTPQATSVASKPAAIDADLEREIRAGITEYVCPDNLGFTGVLKQRYTDFLVNEIGLDGKVLHLTSTEVQKKDKQTQNGSGSNPEPTGQPNAKAKVAELVEQTEARIEEAPNGLEQTRTENIELKKEIDQADIKESNPEVEIVMEEPEEQVCFRSCLC